MTERNKILEQKAYNFALERHNGQTDDSGLSYFDAHITVVADLLSRVTDDSEILAAAWLHDTIEDTNTEYIELVTEFGKRVADLVMEVTHEGKKDEHGYYFPRLCTQEGIMIKFADRLSNISRMQAWAPERRAQYLRKSKFWRSE